MAVTDAYASAAEYRAAVNKDDTAEDAEVLLDLTAMSRYLERKVGRFFTKDAAAVVRIYKPKYSTALYTDDIVSVTSIKVDAGVDGTYETTLTTSEYELTPRNAGDGPEPAPYTAIERISGAWSTTSRVEVTAVFGWPAVPEAIKRATIHMTAFLRAETPFASRGVIDTGEIIEASPHMRGIINDVVRQYGGLVAL